MSGMGRLIGIAGWSGSGKTTLLVKLIPELARRQLRVATIKHAHHAFDIDKPGKDSYEHRAAGAIEVAISSVRRWAIVHENGPDPEPTLEQLVSRMSPADIVLIEGYKREPFPKIEVWRPDTGKPPLYPDDPTVIAVATNDKTLDISLPILPLDDVSAIASFIIEHVLAETGADRILSHGPAV